MPCASPLDAYRPTLGGALQFTYAPPNNGRAWDKIQVPCGTCILCQEEKARQWAVRIAHEAQQWDISSFITLTYAPEKIPPNGSLRYADLQKFWKRLRKRGAELRYYAVGEYGDETMRPHYHACVFGQGFIDNRIIIRKEPTMLWLSPELEEAWGQGQVSVGALTYETARYTASYVTKKLKSKQVYVRIDEETGELIQVEQPKAMMSKNIARDWWDKWGQGVAHHDRVVINARPQKPPKAYDRWLGEVNPPRAEEIKNQRIAKVVKYTEAQNRARARVAHARTRNKSKTV